ncbi:MAG: DNA repair protein RadC [Elusimicrobiota bacterium]
MPMVERPRERLSLIGPEGLKDEELLAILLRTGYRGHSVLDVARTLLSAYPLADLLQIPFQSLRRLRGIGESRAATLVAASELVRRAHPSEPAALPLLRSVNDVAAQAIEIRNLKKEHLLAFFLNARHQMIGKEVISIGTLTASLAHPREIFAPAIGKAAAGVILVHNHPSGDPSPSDEDIRLTKRIAQAGQIMGIELLDHLIVSESGCYSFKTSGGLTRT